MNGLGRQTLAELQRLQKRIDAEIARRTDSSQKKLLKEIEKLVAKEGLSIEDVLGNATTKSAPSKKGKATPASKPKGKVKPKYRHPENAAPT